MSYIVKVRGGGRLVAEYCCPKHGVFDAEVQRTDSGDAPDTAPCPWSMFVDSSTDCCEDCAGTCDYPAPWFPSPVFGRVNIAEVVRGKVERPDSPMFLDLGAGMPYSEWRAKRDKLYAERRHAEAKEFFK